MTAQTLGNTRIKQRNTILKQLFQKTSWPLKWLEEYGGANAHRERTHPLLFVQVPSRIEPCQEGVGTTEVVHKGQCLVGQRHSIPGESFTHHQTIISSR